MATRDELQRLVDGEVEPQEGERLRAGLSPEDRKRLAALEEVARAVREHALSRAAAAPSVWDAIASRLDTEGTEAAAVPLRRWRWMAPVAVLGGLAAAAAMWLFFLGGGATGGVSVESVDFGEATGLLFQVPDTQTTVIWQTTNEEQE
jgi:hypothetical protein